MEFIKVFSSDYANAVSAICGVVTLALAIVTLWFLKREYANRYKPYVVPDVSVGSLTNGGLEVVINVRNVGPHPCEFKLRQIYLKIGDESYETPKFEDWMLIAPETMAVCVPAGHINEQGVKNVREARYKLNRIEVAFVLDVRSCDMRMSSSSSWSYEVSVKGDSPVVMFRSDWRRAI